MKKAVGINDFLERQFKELPFEGIWLDTFGTPERNFRMLIPGQPKNGKTDFCIKFAKYICQWGKLLYNTWEQGVSKTLQDAIRRNNMQEVSGKIMFHQLTFEDLITYLKAKGSPRFIIIDSRDYMNLTADQYKTLIELFPRKSFIVICWGDKDGKPKGTHAEAISFMVDIICPVIKFTAYPQSRFGGNKPYNFTEGKTETQIGSQLKLL